MDRTVVSEDGRFEWDEQKSQSNKENHGFYFEEILAVFDEPFFLELYDEKHSTIEETRYIGLAELQGFIILYLSYTEMANGRTRIISVRPAELKEERYYYEWRKSFIS